MAKTAQRVRGPDSKPGDVSSTPHHTPPAGGARRQTDAPTRRKKGILHDLARAGGISALSRAHNAVSERGIKSLQRGLSLGPGRIGEILDLLHIQVKLRLLAVSV